MGADFCWCLCLTQIPQQSIPNAAKQERAAYPSTVGVTNATIKQEWGTTVGPKEFFKKALKDWIQQKPKQNPPTMQTHRKQFRLSRTGWLNMKWNGQASKGHMELGNAFISLHIYIFGFVLLFGLRKQNWVQNSGLHTSSPQQKLHGQELVKSLS